MTGWRWRALVVLTWLAFAFIVVKCVSWPAHAHDIYGGIVNKEKLSCCAGQDCHFAFTEDRFLVERSGGYILRETGEQIDEGQVGYSPDGNYHICRFSSDGGNGVRKWKAGQIRCLLIPPGGS